MKRLLVANRGEIARRIMRTAEIMGIETVAVFSQADAGAMHVEDANAAYPIGGHASADSYLRIDKIIAAARATGADAIHPGYGFLSENADFAQAVVDAGLIWVGPPPQAIRALGSKSAIKRRAAELDVPCLPGYAGDDQHPERFSVEAQHIGYPVMVKAAAGGGGRGMRLVMHAGELAAALLSARSEAESAFGHGELLVERALHSPRHVEVQVFADTHGHCIHLGERDCSVQRRHQKIIEESPSPAVDDALRERMGACAVRLAQSARYVGAGTVEFLLEGREFYLMEMNTRLQVEHPVTEALTGFDLVEWQIRVARGEPLPAAQADVQRRGHAIEVRLCAEDEHFTPHAGTVRRFIAPSGVRVDHALRDGAVVSPHYDSMIGKLIAHGATREAAIERLVTALERTVVLGVPTNRGLLIECLRSDTFRRGEALIPFLSAEGQTLRERLAQRSAALHAMLFAALWRSKIQGRTSTLRPHFARPMRMRLRGETLDAAVVETAHGLSITMQGQHSVVAVHDAAASSASFNIGASTHRGWWAQAGDSESTWHVQIDGTDAFIHDADYEPVRSGPDNAATRVLAPFNGRVVAVHAAPGQTVAAGDTLLIIESMKLEHAIAAPRAAVVVSVAVEAGQQVASQQLLMGFE